MQFQRWPLQEAARDFLCRAGRPVLPREALEHVQRRRADTQGSMIVPAPPAVGFALDPTRVGRGGRTIATRDQPISPQLSHQSSWPRARLRCRRLRLCSPFRTFDRSPAGRLASCDVGKESATTTIVPISTRDAR